MRVPQLVRDVFDRFPLLELPAVEVIPNESNGLSSSTAVTRELDTSPIIGVYSEVSGLPFDPECMEIYLLFRIANKDPKLRVVSPWSTRKETLPIAWNVLTSMPQKELSMKHEEPTNKQAEGGKVTKLVRIQTITTYEEALKALGIELTAEQAIARTLVTSWIADAFHETLTQPENKEFRREIYGRTGFTNKGESSTPWLFNNFAIAQTDDLLNLRNDRRRQAAGDDYMGTENTLLRAEMSLEALTALISSPLPAEGPNPLDICVFAYTNAMLGLDNATGKKVLTSIIPSKLFDHRDAVMQYIISTGTDLKLNRLN